MLFYFSKLITLPSEPTISEGKVINLENLLFYFSKLITLPSEMVGSAEASMFSRIHFLVNVLYKTW